MLRRWPALVKRRTLCILFGQTIRGDLGLAPQCAHQSGQWGRSSVADRSQCWLLRLGRPTTHTSGFRSRCLRGYGAQPISFIHFLEIIQTDLTAGRYFTRCHNGQEYSRSWHAINRALVRIRSKVWRTTSSSIYSSSCRSICVFPTFQYPRLRLTNDLTHRTHRSNLTSGPPPRLYGALPPNNSTPSNGPSEGLPSYTPYSAASNPGFTSHPAGRPSQRRMPMFIGCGLATCLAIIVFQTLVITCGSGSLARFIDLESAALRVSKERSALVEERD